MSRVRRLLDEIYKDMLDVMASGRPTGSTEKLADELRAFLGLPEWPAQETSPAPNGGMKPTCPNCGHEPCAEWCGSREKGLARQIANAKQTLARGVGDGLIVEDQHLETSGEPVQQCMAARCRKPAKEGSCLCDEHYSALPAPMRGEQP